jgi:uncharacterized protein
MDSEELTISHGEVGLAALWDQAPEPAAVCVLAHGAGAGMRHPFMVGVAESLVAGGVSVLRFNFPYIQARKKYPDRPPVLTEAWRAALDEAAVRAEGKPLAAAGKSIGGRMASLVAAKDGEAFAARALVFLGYPLHAPGKSDQPRDEHLPNVRVPMLFIQGSSDPLATYSMIESLVERLGPLARLHTVEGGNHSFRVRGERKTDADIGRELGTVAAGFIRKVVE